MVKIQNEIKPHVRPSTTPKSMMPRQGIRTEKRYGHYEADDSYGEDIGGELRFPVSMEKTPLRKEAPKQYVAVWGDHADT